MIGKSALVALLVFVSFISLANAYDLSQTWDCSAETGRNLGYCENANHVGWVREVYGYSSNSSKVSFNLGFNAPSAGNYTCQLNVIGTDYGYYDGAQTNERGQLSMNGVYFDWTSDPACNSGNVCDDYNDYTVYSNSKNFSLNAGTNYLGFRAYDSHALRSFSIACNKIVSQSINNATNQTNITTIVNNTNVTINLNQTIINIYNITNYIYLNISGDVNIYNFNYSINGQGNNTLVQNIIFNITNIYNITVYVINNTYIFYNTTIIYGNQTNNNSANSTNSTNVTVPHVNIIYPYNGTIYSNSTLLNVSANWSNNTGNVLYSLDGINYLVFTQNMSINFSFGWNNLTLAVSDDGVNYPFVDFVRFNLVNSSSDNNDSEDQDNRDSADCTDNAYSDEIENQSISFDNLVLTNDVLNLSQNSEGVTEDSFGISGMAWLNVLLFLAIIILFFIIIYLMI